MKYCVGCVHCDLMPGYQGSGGNTYTGPGHHFDPELLCKKEHWKLEMDEDTGIVDIEQAMAIAETCSDFEERSAPDEVTPKPESVFTPTEIIYFDGATFRSKSKGQP